MIVGDQGRNTPTSIHQGKVEEEHIACMSLCHIHEASVRSAGSHVWESRCRP